MILTNSAPRNSGQSSIHISVANGTRVTINVTVNTVDLITLMGEPLANVVWSNGVTDGTFNYNWQTLATGLGFQITVVNATNGGNPTVGNSGSVGGFYSWTIMQLPI